MIELTTPFSEEDIAKLKVGDVVSISGYIYTGRDAVLPKIVKHAEEGTLSEVGVDLQGQVIFHTAVSPAGVGPTSSNKLEIESSFEPLSRHGIKMHLGKGAIKPETVKALAENNAVFAVIPPVTALLESQTEEREVVCYPELGMEALHRIKVNKYQAIIAAAKGESIY
ncbi:tartrate/fumarate family protein [Fibrobacter succinogenes subsp. succinogenes S85]|uniref:Fe-S type hydro-lyase tartrate/fumarate beta region n=1 Tax=Fibrobacter succinogenes (strain ATCC 19169 / S85) TaxID=59374 RepID=C9RML5_FIBSS|nr:fumarate hydratase C-terminal domain-containing protein [Fibrobacter succinogenes]ACX76247.1 Fe-S type hydro-lyase tartrate/fumarate beta region [Fibrobacter succinogenes subsp. succinogenes S85]ADL25357.1 tartrate/fumarate family protein [Fibrobacter succinogenes subsp. succinogenes S85]